MERLSRKLVSFSRGRRSSNPPSNTALSKPQGQNENSSRPKSTVERQLATSAGSEDGGGSGTSEVFSNENADTLMLERFPTTTTEIALHSETQPMTVDRSTDPLRLTLQHGPSGGHVADIIFIHGLGGSSQMTWAKHRRLDLFWPAAWLPKDEDLERSRIFTFGYNAEFRSSNQSSKVGIANFAEDLLFELLFARDAEGDLFQIGKVPIVFVVHSMGGLVFKKAFLDAQLDPKYEVIAASIKAVIFLATPHRGSDLAPYLHRVLSLSFSQTSKQYVSELVAQSPFLRLVNDQFRHVAPRLQIFSFYETLESSIKLSKTMVVDQESARLGYPGEVSRPMNANHYSICKFETPDDPNYQAIKDALKSILASFTDKDELPTTGQLTKLRSFLNISDDTEHDFELFCSRRAEGTCSWILSEPLVQEWLEISSVARLLGLHGRPGRGKSVLAAFLVEHLQQQYGGIVPYFFFRAGDENKRSMGSLLRTGAFQIAQQIPAYRQALLDMADSGYKIKDMEWRAMWRKMFVNSLFVMDVSKPIYWIIDALDEAESPTHLFDLVGDLSGSKYPIKILSTSRWTPALSAAFNKANSKTSTSTLSTDNDSTDIERYVKDELIYSEWDGGVVEEIVSTLLSRSKNNFLWVHLILEEIKDCNTEGDLRQTLSEAPNGMEELYKRMEETICSIRRSSDLKLACQLLTWALYAHRSLFVDELLDILEPEFGRLLNIQQTLIRLCGHFVVLETDRRVGLIHHTAREYLGSTTNLPFSLEAHSSHGLLLKQSISSFMVKEMRTKIQETEARVVDYRATSWPNHLTEASGTSNSMEEYIKYLASFFRHNGVLVWVHALAQLGQLETLTHAARTLVSLLPRQSTVDAGQLNPDSEATDLDCLMGWSRDLHKILGKFGNSLLEQPEAIYTDIAPFCPTSSSIYRLFGALPSNNLTVRGTSEDWDDCLARIAIKSDSSHVMTTALRCSAKYIAISTVNGMAILWDTTTFRQVTSVHHEEHVWDLCFSAKGDRFATYGQRTTKVWTSDRGQLRHTITNPLDLRVRSLLFIEQDTALMMASDQQQLLRASLSDNEPATWDVANATTFIDQDWLVSNDRTWSSAPSMMVLSPDGKRIATVHKNQPLAIWSVDPKKFLRRVTKPVQSPSSHGTKPTDFVSHMSWHPNGDEIMGIYMDACIFKLNIVNGQYQERRTDHSHVPHAIYCSPEGQTYAVCCASGTVQLFDFSTMTLIYQLRPEGGIGQFCFSFDGQRLCDIRGGFCSIWEPDAISPFRTNSDEGANGHKSCIDVSNSGSTRIENKSVVSITLMSPTPRGSLVLLGDDDGAMDLIDYVTLNKMRIHEGHGMSIQCAAWDEKGQQLCYAQTRSKITVVRLEHGTSGPPVRKLEQFKTKEADGVLSQLLLFSDEIGSSILAVYSFSAQMWSLGPATLKGEFTIDAAADHRRWIPHPTSPEHVLSIGSVDIFVHLRTSLQTVSTWTWRKQHLQGQQASDLKQSVADVKSTYHKNFVMVTISQNQGSRRLKNRYFIFDAGSIPTSREDDIEKIPNRLLVAVPEEVTDLIEFPLNVLSNGKLVYINRSFWVCSWNLRQDDGDGNVSKVERHFFIPRDWLAVKSQSLLHITASGHILFPRKERGLSVIENSISLIH